MRFNKTKPRTETNRDVVIQYGKPTCTYLQKPKSKERGLWTQICGNVRPDNGYGKKQKGDSIKEKFTEHRDSLADESL